MPIQSLNEKTVEQRCIICGATNEVDVEDLEASFADANDTGPTAALVAMPPCSTCGSGETLGAAARQAQERSSQGSYGHLHELLVGQLVLQLVQRGRVRNATPGQVDRLRQPGAERLRRWFPNGLALASPYLPGDR